MKKIILILYVLTLAIAFFMLLKPKGDNLSEHKNQPKKDTTVQNKNLKIHPDTPVYHIKAKYWFNCSWQVVFTNDNFLHEENIMNCWDASSEIYGNNIVYALMIFNNESAAVKYAKNFKSYNQCRQFNDSVGRLFVKLTDYRKLHPIEKVDQAAPSSCKNDEGKEVIVY